MFVKGKTHSKPTLKTGSLVPCPIAFSWFCCKFNCSAAQQRITRAF